MNRKACSRVLLAAVLACATQQVQAQDQLQPWSQPQLTIRVNVPAYRMDVYRGDERIRTYSVGVGSATYPTPLGAWDLKYIEWNPWWIPPDSPWAKDAKRTPPGPSNPMGRAKIGFLPLYYMHGNPAGIGEPSSHGCLRMNNEDVLELARLVAKETGAPIGGDEIDALEANSKRTHRVTLPAAARIEIVYRLTEEVDGEVQSYKDIYGMGLTFRDREMRANGGTALAQGQPAEDLRTRAHR